jgi:HD domain
MDTEVVHSVARYAEETMGSEGFRYISAVVANCKMLALELEMQKHDDAGEQEDGDAEEDTDKKMGTKENAPSLNTDALVVAAYLHDISTIEHGFQDHQIKSAEMAVAFLRKLPVSEEDIHTVEQALLTHTTVAPEGERTSSFTEGQVLYDADKLGRLSGLAVVTSLIEFGARYPNRAVTGEVLAAILRHVEERFIELYQSLNTPPAREMAHDKFNYTLAFLDGVVEHLSDATPV